MQLAYLFLLRRKKDIETTYYGYSKNYFLITSIQKADIVIFIGSFNNTYARPRWQISMQASLFPCINSLLT